MNLEHPYIFDHRLANCDKCELRDRRDKTMCLSQRPTRWNGLMVVGEGPGLTESREKVPFLGPQGRLLDALLGMSGLERAETYIANATLCYPPQHAKNLDEDFPHVVPSCQPRLLEEIAHYEPRVILALGRTALLSLTGKHIQKTKREKVECQTCLGSLTLAWYACSACTTRIPYPASGKKLPCSGCGFIHEEDVSARLAKTKMKCPECGGRKTKITEYELFQTEHRIDHVAGAVFDGADLGLPMVRYVIPSYHPSRILKKADTKTQRNNSGQFLFSPALEHFRKAKRLLTTERQWNFDYRTIPSDDAEGFRSWWAEMSAQKPNFFVVDIETDNKEPQAVSDIRCVGINAVWLSDPSHSRSHPVVLWTSGLDAQAPLVRVLAEFLAGQDHKAGQNAILYDTQVLWLHWGIECHNFTEDTLYAHNSVAPDEAHDLQHIALTYTDSPAWKPPKNKNGHQVWESDEELRLYNARDVYNTGLSLAALTTEMLAEDARSVYQLDIAKAHVARGMDRAGLPVDPQAYEQLRQRTEVARAEVAQRLQELTWPGFNPNSHAHLTEMLYKPGGICSFPVKVFTDKGAPSAAKEALFPHRAHPAVATLLEFRKWDRILGTYLGRVDEEGNLETGIAVDSDWRIRCRWNPIGARTGRWSSSPNLMNWPEEIRTIVSTKNVPGRVLFGADMPQAELRVIAALSGDETMIEKCMMADESRKFHPDYDPHSYVASVAFPNYSDIPEWETKTLPDGSTKKFSRRKGLRDAVKAVVYGLNYGAGAAKVLETIMTDERYDGPPLSLEMVERIIDAYFRAFPKIRDYKEKTIEAATRTGYVRDALIRRRRVYPMREVSPTEAANYAIQATVASMMDMSLVELSSQLPSVDPSAFLIAQLHDAIYGECDQTRASATCDLLGASMSQRIRLVPGAPFMDFPVTAKYGQDWASL